MPCQNCLNVVLYYFLSLLNVAIHFRWTSQLHLNKILLFCLMVIQVTLKSYSSEALSKLGTHGDVQTLHPDTVCCCFLTPATGQPGRKRLRCEVMLSVTGLCAPRFLSLMLLYCCHRSLCITASQQQKPADYLDRLCPESLLTYL